MAFCPHRQTAMGAAATLAFTPLNPSAPMTKLTRCILSRGTGLKATRIQLWQGRRYTITVVDDVNMTLPAPNTYVTVVDIIGGGGTSYTCRVIDNGYNAARKVEGKRELTVEVLTLIELGGSVPEA